MTVSTRAAAPGTSTSQFANDVRQHLSRRPRQLPTRYLYDALGSELFDAICHLPWYPITRAEMRLLAEHGRSILGRIGRTSTIVELGGGSGEKLVTLVEAGGEAALPLDLHLVDVSARALEASARALRGLPAVRIVTHQAPYEVGLEEVRRERTAGARTLTLFLGSNIGNFDPPAADAFLRAIREGLVPGDHFLIGTDLVKPEAALRLAYDDPLGVTAAFNRNLLLRINRELGGNFDLDGFEHRAVWNARHSRVEMHLVSRRRQALAIRAAETEFVMDAGETLWTESSYKYRPDDVVETLARAGFRLVEQWVERVDAFALTLVEAV